MEAYSRLVLPVVLCHARCVTNTTRPSTKARASRLSVAAFVGEPIVPAAIGRLWNQVNCPNQGAKKCINENFANSGGPDHVATETS